MVETGRTRVITHENTRNAVRKYTKISCLFVFLVLCCFVGFIYACPGCTELTKFGKDAAQSLRFGKGIAWSILLLFAVPVCLVGGMVGTVIYLQRKSLQIQKDGNQPAA